MSLTRALTSGAAQLLRSAASTAMPTSTKVLAATLVQAGHFHGLYESSVVSRSSSAKKEGSLPPYTAGQDNDSEMDALSEEEIVNMLGLEAAASSSTPSASPSLVSQLQQWWRERRRNGEDGMEESSGVADDGSSSNSNSGIWLMAVPKRKTSHAVKRKRQMNPLYQNDKEILHAYPCPKCDKGYIKLRHHLCPCDQEKLNCRAVVKVSYAVGVKKTTAEMQLMQAEAATKAAAAEAGNKQ